MQSTTTSYIYQGGPVQHQSPTQPHHHQHPHHAAVYEPDVISHPSRHHHHHHRDSNNIASSYGPPWASASPSLSSYADLSWTSSAAAPGVTSGPPLPFPPSFSYQQHGHSSSGSTSPTTATSSSTSTLYHPNHQYLLTSSSSRPRADSLPALAPIDTKPVLPRLPTNGEITQERSRDSRSPPSPTLSATAGSTATTSRPYLCPTCPMSFARAHDLKRHRDTHTQERKHCCPYCGKTLSRKDALKRHVLSKQCPAEGGKDGIWPPPPGFVPRIPNAASVISAANSNNGNTPTGAFGQGRTLPALPTGWPNNNNSTHSHSQYAHSSSSSLRSASSLRSSSSTSPTSSSAPYHIPHRGSTYPYSDTRHAAYQPYA